MFLFCFWSFSPVGDFHPIPVSVFQHSKNRLVRLIEGFKLFVPVMDCQHGELSLLPDDSWDRLQLHCCLDQVHT